jgi:diguanylate cyclase (GGDEF)-like protein
MRGSRIVEAGGIAHPEDPTLTDPARHAPDLETLVRSYETLFDVAHMLLGSASLPELLDGIARELKRLVPYDALTVYRLDAVAQMLVPLHSVDDWADEIMDAPLSVERGITGWVVRHGRAENIADTQPDPRLDLVPGTDNEPEALASVPLMVRGGPIGALNVYRLGAGVSFTDDEFALVCRFAGLAALALDHTENRERLLHEAQSDWLTDLGNHRFFQDRLRVEVERAQRYGRPLSLVSFDLDDFKLLNDVHGHQEGDLVLRRVAAAAAAELRATDVACRVGGEEFAILLPETTKREARAVAARLCARVRRLPAARRITTSCGVATLPTDAASATELVRSADAALYAAKARGKDRAVSYSARSRRGRRDTAASSMVESLAQLRLLGTLSVRLHQLNDVAAIADTIVRELRTIVDYQDARVYLIADDGATLDAIGFGATAPEYAVESADALRLRVGEGITGRAVKSGRTLNVGDAGRCEFRVEVPGTDPVDESVLAVPLRHDGRTIGAIVLSRLGVEQFPRAIVRLVEIVAAQAAGALANARTFASERRAARAAQAALAVASAALAGRSPESALAAAALEMLPAAAGAAVVARASGRPRVVAAAGDPGVRSLAPAVARVAYGGVRAAGAASLPAVSADAPGALAQTVAVPLAGGGLLVVAGPAFTPADREAMRALAAAAAPALDRPAPPLAEPGGLLG